MIYRQPRVDEGEAYEALARHPMQATAWGNFREETGADAVRLVGFEDRTMASAVQVIFHPIPKISYTIGNCSKGEAPTEVMLKALYELGQEKKAIFIKIEPDVTAPPKTKEELQKLKELMLTHGCEIGRAHFFSHTYLMDLTKSEEEILNGMKPKTRYNIGVAEKHGVEIVEDNSDTGFEEYLKLQRLTTSRQQFFAHSRGYHLKMWQQMRGAGIARLLRGVYQGETVVAWVLFHYKDTLHYPYGASSRKYREVMASNKMMWEVIKLGKKLGAKILDMWGCLGPEPDEDHPWYGFHRFKEGFGGTLTEYVGSFDLVVDPKLYQLYRLADRWRWRWMNFRKKLSFI